VSYALFYIQISGVFRGSEIFITFFGKMPVFLEISGQLIPYLNCYFRLEDSKEMKFVNNEKSQRSKDPAEKKSVPRGMY
jgi:hypothetical protein